MVMRRGGMMMMMRRRRGEEPGSTQATHQTHMLPVWR